MSGMDTIYRKKMSRLLSFAKNQKKKYVAAFLSASDLTSNFYLPLSEQAHQEFT